MWDRFDPRSSDDRDHGDTIERSQGSRGAATDRERNDESRDVFTRDLDLPLGCDRELVRVRERDYEINGAEGRALATIGAFRVVQVEDLRSCFERDETSRRESRDDLSHLREAGLVQTLPRETRDKAVVVLTNRGREVLEYNRHERDGGSHQTFYAGLRKPRELTHDAQVYRAFCRAEQRLRDSGGRVQRVVLDYELKREYQQFLQARNRGRADSDGRPDRDMEEVARWAREHELPFFDDSLHFPDCRIEYEDRDGRSRHEDLEIVTEHYRGAHGASAAKSGFTRYRSGGLSGSGSRSGRGRGRGRDAHLAEEFLG